MTTVPHRDLRELDVLRASTRALLRRRWLFASVAAATLTLTGAAIGTLPRSYVATTDVLLGDREIDSIHVAGTSAGGAIREDALANEVVFAQSDNVLRSVEAGLALASNPEFNSRLRSGALDQLRRAFSLSGREDPMTQENDILEVIRKRISVGPVGHSHVLRITATSVDASTSAALANAVSKEWRASRLELQAAANREAYTAITERLTDLRARADASAEAASRYRTEHGLVRGATGPAQQDLDDAVRALSAASQRLAEAEAERDQVTRALADSTIDRLGSVLGSTNLAKLQELEAVAKAQQLRLAGEKGTSHPDMQSAAAEFASFRERSNLERRRIAGHLVDEVRSAQGLRAAAAARLDRARTAAAQADHSQAGLEALQRVADTDQALFQAFLARSKETGPDVFVQIGNLQEIARATPPTRPASPNVMLLLGIAAVASLAAGSLAVVAAETRRRGLVSEEEVETVLGRPALGLLPRHGSGLPEMKDAASELLVRIMRDAKPGERLCVAITSALPSEGKSTAALLLARAGSEQGRRVLLVDGDLRRASLTRKLTSARRNVRGFADVLAGRIALADAICQLPTEKFSFLPAGELTGRPTDLLACSAGFLAPNVTRGFDLIVVDTPPVLVGGDTALLAREADQTVFLARWAKTPPANATAALRRLDAGRIQVTGIVLSLVDTRLNAQYGHGEALTYSRRLSAYYSAGVS